MGLCGEDDLLRGFGGEEVGNSNIVLEYLYNVSFLRWITVIWIASLPPYTPRLEAIGPHVVVAAFDEPPTFWGICCPYGSLIVCSPHQVICECNSIFQRQLLAAKEV